MSTIAGKGRLQNAIGYPGHSSVNNMNCLMFSSRLIEFFHNCLWFGLVRSCSMEGRWRLSSSFCHNGVTPEREGLVKRDSSISLGRAVQGMEVIELMNVMNVSCCWEVNEDMSFQPRRLVRAMLGHLVGRPWMVRRILRWMRSSIRHSVLLNTHSSHPYSVIGSERAE